MRIEKYHLCLYYYWFSQASCCCNKGSEYASGLCVCWCLVSFIIQLNKICRRWICIYMRLARFYKMISSLFHWGNQRGIFARGSNHRPGVIKSILWVQEIYANTKLHSNSGPGITNTTLLWSFIFLIKSVKCLCFQLSWAIYPLIQPLPRSLATPYNNILAFLLPAFATMSFP